MRRGGPAANEKEQIRSYPTPSLMDVVFYEYRDYTLPKNQNPEYGVTTPEHGNWPNHKLAFISPAKEDGHQKWVYVADRENQDDYNYEVNGDSVVRTYVIPRENYFQNPFPNPVAEEEVTVTGVLVPDATSVMGRVEDLGVFPQFSTEANGTTYPATRCYYNGTSWVLSHHPGAALVPYGLWTSANCTLAECPNPAEASGWVPFLGVGMATPTGTPIFSYQPAFPGDSNPLTNPEGDDEFYYPPAGAASPDIRFPGYCFADDTVVRSNDPEIDSRYVVIKRRFIRPVTVEYIYDDQFERNIRITKEIVPSTTTEPEAQVPGTNVELRDGNFFHSVLITKEIMNDEEYPYALREIPGTHNHRFPAKLEYVDLVWAAAWASSPGNRDSYSQDYFFKYKITEPRPGPYSAVFERYITDDPESVKTAHPITIVPQPVRESICITSAWAFASEELGNATQASAKEHVTPATIHNEITVNKNEVGGTGQAESVEYTITLDETPGYTAFVALTEAVLDYRVREMPLGLFEVSVVRVDIGGLYS